MAVAEKIYIRQSEAVTFWMCGQRREYEYVQGLKVAPSEVLTIGTVVDMATTYALKHKIETKELPSEPDLIQYLQKCFKEREDETDWQGESTIEALQMAIDLTKLWYAKAAPNIDPIAVQEYIKVDLPDRPLWPRGHY